MSAHPTRARRERRRQQRAAGKALPAGLAPALASPPPVGWPGSLLANTAPISLCVLFALLHTSYPDVYQRSVQEDAALEWATFWAFLGAAGVWALGVVHHFRHAARRVWCMAGLSLFCLVVALEEISWGQRLLGYQAPEYFLAHNFQQEFTVHNVLSTPLRALAIKAVIVGYGILLPLLACVGAVRAVFARLAILPPPVALIPGFLVMFVLRQVYPWSYTGEVVEGMLGVGFLCAALLRPPLASGPPAVHTPPAPVLGRLALGLVLVGVLGGATASGVQWLRPVDNSLVGAAEREVQRLGRDFRRGRVHRPAALYERNVEKRVYSYQQKYQVELLGRGAFARLTRRGLPPKRAQFFLDPWNMPYWISSIQAADRSRAFVFVYSFGPNRRRDSSRWQLQGDDIGWVVRQGGLAAPAPGPAPD